MPHQRTAKGIFASPLHSLCLAAALYGALASICAQVDSASQKPNDMPGEVQDLAYGEVLFDFYQENYFDAISRLQQAQAQGELNYHAKESELLLGGMSLAYGLDRDATQRFNALLNETVRPEVRDRAWYYLGRMAFQKGRPADAAAALAHIDLQDDSRALRKQRAEQRMLFGHVQLAQGNAAAAVQAFSDWKGPADERDYADYNLGIAMLESGQVDAGLKQLDKLGERPADNDEQYALRDKTNLALGYRLLQAGKAAQARPYFDRVRLQGPLSSRALLGAGWADAEQEQFKQALIPWLELHGRDSRDLATQESWLAVPYAYAQLGAEARAVELYQAAIMAFSDEARALDQAIAALDQGRLIETLLTAEGSGRSWFWQVAQLPTTPETRYLIDMLAGHRFQEAVKNLRDLQDLRNRLQVWADKTETFEHMVETRRLRYAAAAPRLHDDLQRLDVDTLTARHESLGTELQQITANNDANGLMTSQERLTWAQLEFISARLARLPDSQQVRDLRDKQARLRGLLLWEVEADYKARLRMAKKNLRETEAPLREANSLAARAQSAFATAPAAFEGFDQRIVEMRERVRNSQTKVDSTLAAQGAWITRLAQADLTLRKQRVDAYLVQARFALAQTYDKAGLPAGAAP
ncbi:MAG: hypothetical protein KKE76_05115 [Gammaproteobacteria bacterium]|nr:hypothetical protein [Gammaproteobacteria bacterium]